MTSAELHELGNRQKSEFDGLACDSFSPISGLKPKVVIRQFDEINGVCT